MVTMFCNEKGDDIDDFEINFPIAEQCSVDIF